MIDVLLENARVSSAAGDMAKAKAILDQAIIDYPHDIRSYLDQGAIAQSRGQTSEAIQWYDRAEAVGPANFWPYYLRAKIKDEGGDPSAAAEYLLLAFQNCRGLVSEVEYQNIARFYCDVENKVHNVGDKEQSRIMAVTNASGKAIDTAVRVSLVKDEDDIIYAGLKSSYLTGFRYFVIADNNSADETVAEIKRFQRNFPDAIVYIVYDPVVAYHQAEKTMGLAHLGLATFSALGKKVEWVFPLDADEEIHFPHGGTDLADYLTSASEKGVKLISYALCNVCSDEPIQSSAPMDLLPGPYKINSVAGDRVVCKVAFRMERAANLVVGNHYCEIKQIKPDEIAIGSEIGMYIKHYPMRSILHLQKKATNGLKSLIALQTDRGIGAHWRRDGVAYEEQGDEFLQTKLRSFIDQIKNARTPIIWPAKPN